MSFGRWLARAMVDSLIAGLAVGVLELTRIALASSGGWSLASAAALAWMVIGLVALGAALAGPALCGAAAVVARVRPIGLWLADLRAGGGERAAAVVRATVGVIAFGAVAAITFLVARWTHEEFNEPSAIALLEAALLPAAGLVVLVGAGAASRRLAARAAACAPCVRLLTGGRGARLVAFGAIALMAGAPAVAAAAAPAATLDRPAAALHFVVLLALVRGLGVGRLRGGRAIAAAVAALALSAPLGLRAAPTARAAISSHGAASRQVIVLVWRAFDRDGDGVPSQLVGGADCDDGDRTVSPTAAEVLDNGRDENCNGRDATRAALAHRFGVRPPSGSPAARYNVLLVTIDSLRADHIGVYGYRRPTSPTLDALAARSTRFAWTFSPTPSTRWAIPSLATGRFASTAGINDKGSVKSNRGPTLGKVFSAAGYETAGIMCCERFFGRPSGALAGLAHVDATASKFYKTERPEKYNSDELARRVVRFLDQRKPDSPPFFLWTHIIDPHHPYFQLPGSPEWGSKAIDRYDSEIHFVDRQLATMLRALDRTHLADHTIVVVTADHGDGFKEHGTYHHGHSLYNQELRVPMVVHVPGSAARVIDDPISLVDLAPTLYDLTGLVGPAGMNGQSLAAAVLGRGPVPPRPVLAELFPDREIERSLLAVIDGCDKLVWDRQANTVELYSRCDDPDDAHDRARAEPDTVDRLRLLMADRSEIELTPLPK